MTRVRGTPLPELMPVSPGFQISEVTTNASARELCFNCLLEAHRNAADTDIHLVV